MKRSRTFAAFTFIAFGFSFFPSSVSFLLLSPLWTLLRVHALVPPQVAKGTAGVAALVAAVWLLACVGACVALQVNELGGSVGADGATVGLLAIMDPHVALQVVGVVRAEGAQRAGVQFGGEGAGTTGLTHNSPLPLRATDNRRFSQLHVFRLRGIDGGFVLQALLTG